MAVLAEATSVIVKFDSIEKRIPGGWEAFTGWVQNNTLCADGEVARVGFRSPDEAEEFIEALEAQGLQRQRDGEAADLVVSDQQRGLAATCDWAEFGRIPWRGDDKKTVPAVRLVNAKCTELMTPIGWVYEGS